MIAIKNNILTAVLGAALVLTISSCSSYLTETSESKRTLDSFYQNEDQAEAGIRGVYVLANNIYNSAALSVTTVGTDELYARNTTSAQGVVDRYETAASNTNTTKFYQVHYRMIQGANVVIANTSESDQISDDVRTRVISEAKVLRAWGYFRLVQTFGRVPLVLEQTELINFRVRRYPIQEIYESIIKDLKEACEEGNLPAGADPGRINHWTAKGLLAKVYLTLGTSMSRRPQPIEEYRTLEFDILQLYRDALSLCDEIIASGEYHLEDDYSKIFLLNNKNCAESMWELQFSDNPSNGSAWSKNFGVGQQSNSNAYQENCMVGQRAFCPVPSFYKYFKHGDARRNWSIADYRILFDKTTLVPLNLNYISAETISESTGELCNLETDDPDSLARSIASLPASRISVSKYRWGIGSDPDLYWKESLSFESTNLPTNVIVLRYADILLMRIEADMLINGGYASGESLDIMNDQLLARARGINPSTGAYYTSDEVFAVQMAFHKERMDMAQAAYDESPTSANLDALENARQSYDYRKVNVLVDYTAETLTYDELLTQRACELCFEFHRWFDLSRTSRLHILVPSRIIEETVSPKAMFDFDKHYLMPIPTYELDIASDKTLFYQNPGY